MRPRITKGSLHRTTRIRACPLNEMVANPDMYFTAGLARRTPYKTPHGYNLKIIKRAVGVFLHRLPPERMNGAGSRMYTCRPLSLRKLETLSSLRTGCGVGPEPVVRRQRRTVGKWIAMAWHLGIEVSPLHLRHQLPHLHIFRRMGNHRAMVYTRLHLRR
jgi:hypothetical protein